MYERILVPLDGSATSKDGLNEAIRLAAISGGQLRLMHALDEISFPFAYESAMAYADHWHDLLREDGEAILSHAHETAKAAGVRCETCLSDSSAFPVYQRIASEADRWKADLIVTGTHGRHGVQRWLLGSTAEGVVRHASKPVLLVRGTEHASDPAKQVERTDQRRVAAILS